MRLRIYVAGPYTKPDPCINTHEAIEVADFLWSCGFAPFIPHLSHFWHTMSPKPYEDWLEYDLQFLVCCDALFRMDGESSGADAEEKFANDHNIPVFYTYAALTLWSTAKQELPF